MARPDAHAAADGPALPQPATTTVPDAAVAVHATATTARAASSLVLRYRVMSRPRLMAMTASASPALTHGDFAWFQRPRLPSTRRLLTIPSSATSGTM